MNWMKSKFQGDNSYENIGGEYMGDKDILLTYIKDGKEGFDWFDNIQDMEISIIERGIREEDIVDIIRIKECEDIELSRECKVWMEK